VTAEPSQTRARVRQGRILDAALSVFTKRGYREASVDEIAEEAETSKGGVYFHFPGKQTLFRALLDLSSRKLMERIEAAIAKQTDPLARADAALTTVLSSFAGHRALARLFMVEAMGAGPEFQVRILQIHDEFIAVIKLHLDAAVEQGIVQPIDTSIASRAWFGALNEVILHWLFASEPKRLEDAYLSLRPLLRRSVGLKDA
jgi:TetR/AcrR family transcriptional regulator, fatty acid metabolism regulator protein